tara:strand:- start:1730 stop:2497 length:768 start_codon:yes stop_codon:yes gene_type:complete
MISPKQLKLGASILIGAIMAFAVLSYLYVSSQYEQVSLNATIEAGQEDTAAAIDPCAEDEAVVRYQYVGSDSGVKENVSGHNTVSSMLFLQVRFSTLLMILAVLGLLVGIVLSIIHNRKAAISLAIALGVFVIVYIISAASVSGWDTTPYAVYEANQESLMGSKSSVVAEEVTVSEEEAVEEETAEIDSTSTDEAAQSSVVVCEESEEDEMYGEGVVNRAATGVVALMVFLGLGLLAIVFAILYPIALTILPSKK